MSSSIARITHLICHHDDDDDDVEDDECGNDVDDNDKNAISDGCISGWDGIRVWGEV